MGIVELLDKIVISRVWDTEPVFCFTMDVDWASETVLERTLTDLRQHDLKLTTFVTHESQVIQQFKNEGCIQRGIHPNFLPNSSHGEGFRAIIENCLKFAPETKVSRSHRLFDVTDVTHMLHDEFGFEYVSNLGTTMQPAIKPVLHESGLVHFPIFYEDGSHLFNKLSLRLSDYKSRFLSPGIKIISIHPLDYTINTPEINYARKIKDSLSRDEYNKMSHDDIKKFRNTGPGISNMVNDIITMAKAHKVMSLEEMFHLTIS